MYRLTLTTLVIGLGFIVTSAHAKSINRPADARRILEESIAKPDGTRPLRMDRADRRIVTTIMTEPGDIPQLKVEVDGKNLPLPLEHTHVHAELTGYVAEVEVTQTYNNPFTYPIEAIYIFPLPENSAVHAMKIVIGERIIEADIKKRQEARQIYQQAKASGHTAALLEQERPNIFTQSVANIAPGKRIDVVITYLQHLSYDAGEYEFVFPMVVGPRFHPGQATGTRKGHGYATDTHLVPDASRISPPVLGAGHRSGHDISIDLLADAGFPIGEFDVPTHQVDIHPTFDGSLAMQLSSSDTLPNRDFVLRYRVDASQPKATFIPHKDGEHGYFSLIVQPPRLDVEELVGQRELIFVVDVSGSMHGVPLSMCKAAMEEALGNLRPVDTFNVITFAGRTAQVFQSARPANNTNLRAATEFIDGLKAGGGTMMADGVRAALSPSIETGRHRYVFFLTDGYVGNEKQILDLTRRYITEQQKTSRARVFGFGVGSSVNRHLLDGFAKAGNGATFYSTTREDPARAVNGYFRLIDHPVISDVKIDFGGLDVDAIYPARLPDLFASRPLIINGRFKNAGSEIITIRGTANGRPVEIPLNITLPEVEGRNPAVKKLWARAKIDWLERDLWGGNNAQTIESITNLGLKFHLVTAFTSLVAVDKSQTVDGESKTILQPVETPEGVNAQMAGAATTAGMAGLGISGGAALGGGMGNLRTVGRGIGGGGYGRGTGGMGGVAYGQRVSGKARPKKVREYRKYKQNRPYSKSVAPAAPEARPQPSVMADKDDREDLSITRSPGVSAGEKRNSKMQITVKGGLNKRMVEKLVKSKLESLKACLRKSGLSGTVRVRISFFVTPQGVILQPQAIGNFNKKTSACLKRSIRSWRLKNAGNLQSAEVKMVVILKL